MSVKFASFQNDALLRRLTVLFHLALVCGPPLAFFWSLQLLFWRGTVLLGYPPQFLIDSPDGIGEDDWLYHCLYGSVGWSLLFCFLGTVPSFFLSDYFCRRYDQKARKGWSFPFAFVVSWLMLFFCFDQLKWFFD